MTRNKKLVKLMALAVAASTVATSVPAYAAFDATYYAQQNPDVVAAIGTKPADLETHYNVFGKKEGRAGSADEAGSALRQLFDAEFYAKMNPDVVAVLGNDANALFNHFLQFGIKEGRRINPYFDVNAYKKAYPDLVAAFGDDIAAYYNHFANHGISEHRTLGGFPAEKIVPGAAVAYSGGASSSSSSSGSSGSSSKPATKPAEEQVTPTPVTPDKESEKDPEPTPAPTPTPAETAKTAEAAVKTATKALKDAHDANIDAQKALADADVDSLAPANKAVASKVANVAGAKGTNAATQKYVDATQKLVDTAASAISDAKANPTSDNKTAAEKAAKEAVASAQSTLVRAQANTEKAIDAADAAADALMTAQVAVEAAKNAKEAAIAEKTATQAVIDKLDNLIAISDKNLADAQATIVEAEQAYTKAGKDRADALKVANAAVTEAEKLYKYVKDVDGKYTTTEDSGSKTVTELRTAITNLRDGIEDVAKVDAEAVGFTVSGTSYIDKSTLSTDEDFANAEELYQAYLDAVAKKKEKAVKDAATALNELVPGIVVDGEIDSSELLRAKKAAGEAAINEATKAIVAWDKAVVAYNSGWTRTDTVGSESTTYSWAWTSDDSKEMAEFELNEAFKLLQKAGVVKSTSTVLSTMKVASAGMDTANGPKYQTSSVDSQTLLYDADDVGTAKETNIQNKANDYKDAYVEAHGGTKSNGTTTVAKGSTEKASDFKALSDDVVTKTTARDNAKKVTDAAIENQATVLAEENEKVAEANKAVEDAKFDRSVLVKERYVSTTGSDGSYNASVETATNDKLALQKETQETALDGLDDQIKENEKAEETANKAVEEATTNKANADAALEAANAMEDTAEQQLDTANGQVREVNGIRVTE